MHLSSPLLLKAKRKQNPDPQKYYFLLFLPAQNHQVETLIAMFNLYLSVNNMLILLILDFDILGIIC